MLVYVDHSEVWLLLYGGMMNASLCEFSALIDWNDQHTRTLCQHLAFRVQILAIQGLLISTKTTLTKSNVGEWCSMRPFFVTLLSSTPSGLFMTDDPKRATMRANNYLLLAIP